MCTAGATYAPVGRAIADRREKVFLQVHFGAVYDENGEYGWCRDFETIRKTFLWELEQLNTNYVDFGFLHCVDEDEDFDKLVEIGVLDYIKELKAKGIVRHIGFSSHTPSVANRILDTGLIDMMMFSINPAYDFEKGDEYGIGSVKERFELFRRKVFKRKVFTVNAVLPVRAGFPRFALVALLAFQRFLLLFREDDANHPDVKRVPLFVGRRLNRNNNSVGAANLGNALKTRRLPDVEARPNRNANRRIGGAVQRLKGYMVARIKRFRVKSCGSRSAVVAVPEPAPLDRVNDRFRRNGHAVIVNAAGAVS
jgi:hypothetical protein